MKGITSALFAIALMASGSASAQQAAKPNIVVIWGDDILYRRTRCVHHGRWCRSSCNP